MAALPEIVSKAWDDRKGPVILATVDAGGALNAIYATCVKKFSEAKLVIADNFFSKTRANIQAGSSGALLFITNEGKAYQVKGRIDYLTSGEIFDDMKSWNGDRPGHAAAVVNVEEVFAGAEKLL
ncbi:MAG: pyridoxamine 5'-phosphate oxidase family protein [Phycisphaerae bacterium]|nr:pyridoxamine 5'-phosphate oxidase family protein [Phycisphaerae bacterium]